MSSGCNAKVLRAGGRSERWAIDPVLGKTGRNELGAAWFTDDTEHSFYTGCRLPQHVPSTSHLVRFWSADHVVNSLPEISEDDTLGRPPRPAKDLPHHPENCVHTFKALNVFSGQDSFPALILRCKSIAARRGVWVT